MNVIRGPGSWTPLWALGAIVTWLAVMAWDRIAQRSVSPPTPDNDREFIQNLADIDALVPTVARIFYALRYDPIVGHATNLIGLITCVFMWPIYLMCALPAWLFGRWARNKRKANQ